LPIVSVVVSEEGEILQHHFVKGINLED